MFHQSVEALIDSGAAVSCISEEFYRTIQSPKTPLQNSCIQRTQGVSGETLLVCGEITIPVVFDRFTVQHTFQMI